MNNAGILRDKAFNNMSMEDFEFAVQVHFMGTVYCTKAAWPIMRKQQYGRIVVTTSGSGTVGNFGQSNYGAAKMAVNGLINVLRLEGAKYNILCNAISPSARTRMTEALLPPRHGAVHAAGVRLAGGRLAVQRGVRRQRRDHRRHRRQLCAGAVLPVRGRAVRSGPSR